MRRTGNIYYIRKCKKSANIISRNKLLDACLNGNGDLFKEIKALRKTEVVTADSIDGVKDDVPRHFKGIYEDLYSSVKEKDELENIKENLELQINSNDLYDVDKVTSSIVEKAAKHLKMGNQIQFMDSVLIALNMENKNY